MKEKAQREAEVLNWLRKEGYPLEMQVAKLLKSRTSWEVRQAWCYDDIQAESSREIDVVASSSDIMGLAAIHFAFECKSNAHPWLLLTSEGLADSANKVRAHGIWSPRAWNVYGERMLGPWFTREAPAEGVPYIDRAGAKGYSLVQSIGGASSAPYSALVSALKAARSFLRCSPQHNEPPRMTVAFPTVVLSGELYECRLNQEGDIELASIKQGNVFFQQRIGDIKPQFVPVVTLSGLVQFVEESESIAKGLHKVFLPEIHKIMLDDFGVMTDVDEPTEGQE